MAVCCCGCGGGERLSNASIKSSSEISWMECEGLLGLGFEELSVTVSRFRVSGSILLCCGG